MVIYLLYWHDEWGPEDLVATSDRDLLPRMLESFAQSEAWKENREAFVEYRGKLAELLQRTDDDLMSDRDGIHQLGDGWGRNTSARG